MSLNGSVIAQGEKVVGSGTVQLVTTQKLCKRVWIGAPTANHTKGSPNTGNILVGVGTVLGGTNAGGGIPLDPSNTPGFFYPVTDASRVYLTGFNAGDAIEYQIFN